MPGKMMMRQPRPTTSPSRFRRTARRSPPAGTPHHRLGHGDREEVHELTAAAACPNSSSPRTASARRRRQRRTTVTLWDPAAGKTTKTFKVPVAGRGRAAEDRRGGLAGRHALRPAVHRPGPANGVAPDHRPRHRRRRAGHQARRSAGAEPHLLAGRQATSRGRRSPTASTCGTCAHDKEVAPVRPRAKVRPRFFGNVDPLLRRREDGRGHDGERRDRAVGRRCRQARPHDRRARGRARRTASRCGSCSGPATASRGPTSRSRRTARRSPRSLGNATVRQFDTDTGNEIGRDAGPPLRRDRGRVRRPHGGDGEQGVGPGVGHGERPRGAAVAAHARRRCRRRSRRMRSAWRPRPATGRCGVWDTATGEKVRDIETKRADVGGPRLLPGRQDAGHEGRVELGREPVGRGDRRARPHDRPGRRAGVQRRPRDARHVRACRRRRSRSRPTVGSSPRPATRSNSASGTPRPGSLRVRGPATKRLGVAFAFSANGHVLAVVSRQRRGDRVRGRDRREAVRVEAGRGPRRRGRPQRVGRRGDDGQRASPAGTRTPAGSAFTADGRFVCRRGRQPGRPRLGHAHRPGGRRNSRGTRAACRVARGSPDGRSLVSGQRGHDGAGVGSRPSSPRVELAREMPLTATERRGAVGRPREAGPGDRVRRDPQAADRPRAGRGPAEGAAPPGAGGRGGAGSRNSSRTSAGRSTPAARRRPNWNGSANWPCRNSGRRSKATRRWT